MGLPIILEQYRSLCDDKGILKEQYKIIADKGFHYAINFLDDFDNELVRFILSRIHDQFMWLDQPHKITKEAIHAVTIFYSTGEVILLRSMPKDNVEKVTGSKWDGKAMPMSNINDPVVKYVLMVFGYRIYYSSKMNSILATAIQTAYQMVKENVDYDLVEALRSQPMVNLEVVNKDKELRFKFGQLILGLFFYFQNNFPDISDV